VEMREMIRGLGGRHTVLLSSHLLSQIHETCDRILVVDRGRIKAQGSEQELAARLGAGRERLEVEVRGSRDAVEKALAPIAGIESRELEEAEDGVTRATAVATRDVREQVASALVAAGCGLRSLRRLEPELESLFVEIARAGGEEEAR